VALLNEVSLPDHLIGLQFSFRKEEIFSRYLCSSSTFDFRSRFLEADLGLSSFGGA